MAKRRWADMSPGVRAAVVAGGVAELVVTVYALRDLLHRPSELVRGPKAVWCPMLFVQPVGAPLYLIVGRRAMPA